MATQECPSCGNMVGDGQLFCPMCGTKIERTAQTVKSQINRELESLLFTVNSNAEVALSKNLGAGLVGQNNYNNLIKLENAYLEIIQRFPTESKAYIAYVDYMIKYILKINSLTSVFAATTYFIGDLNVIVPRCRNYLQKAKEFADEADLEQILQLDSQLSSKIESISRDTTIQTKQEKNKNIAKWCYIGTGILFAVLFFVWIIAEGIGA